MCLYEKISFPQIQLLIALRNIKVAKLDLFAIFITYVCCRGVVAKHADCRGCEFNSSMRHSKNANDEGGNGKPPHKKSTSFEKSLSPVSGFCYAQNQLCDSVTTDVFYI